MTHNKQLSFYDIVIDRNAPQQGLPPPVVSAPKTAQTQSDTAAVLCPYKIPTVDEIIKQIENNDYIVDYKGVRCHALFNWFVGAYFTDDVYGIIKTEEI